MKLLFDLISTRTATQSVAVDINQCIVAGWAGRDLAAIEHHIEELAALGVPRPSAVPLYYRIAAFPIVLPPLRERREDIALLADSMLQRSRGMRDRLQLSPEEIGRAHV